MKDYTLNSEEAVSFILNYEIKDNQIIVNYANGEHYIISYTNDNEEKILKKMEDQVYNEQQNYKQSNKILGIAVTRILFNVFGIILCVGIVKSGHSIAPLILYKIYPVLFNFNIGVHILYIRYIKEKRKDFEKNKMLLDNQEKLNEMIKENQNILTNSNEKIKEMVKSTPEDKPVFNLNSVEKLKLKELKAILENIQREEEFKSNYSSDNESNDEPLTLSKSIDKNQSHK